MGAFPPVKTVSALVDRWYIRHNELYRQRFDLSGSLLEEVPVAVNDAVMMYSPYLEGSKEEG